MACVNTNGGSDLGVGFCDVIGTVAETASEVFRQLRKNAWSSPLGRGVRPAEKAFWHVASLMADPFQRGQKKMSLAPRCQLKLTVVCRTLKQSLFLVSQCQFDFRHCVTFHDFAP